MTLEPLSAPFSICKLAGLAGVDLQEEFCFFSHTDEEYSLVCRTTAAPADALQREDGWRGLRICGELDFSLIGIVARISRILAENRIGIFAISTFNTDYVFTRESQFTKALSVLVAAGYEIEQGPPQ